MEHLQHFGLTQDPFQNESDLRFYFESASHREPERRVERGLRQNKGLTVVTGEGGSGKTLLSRRIFESLEEEIFEATLMVMLPGATDAHDVLSRFARQMGVEEPAAERAALLAQVYERFAMVREEGRHAVLILDDAHLLSSDALAEIGGLLNLEYEDRRLLSLLLLGLPELDVALSQDACLGQRVDVRVKIAPLTLEDTAAYLRHRIAFVGGQAEILADDAVSSLFKYGRGRPRLLNTLADNALFEAYLGGRSQLSASDVERAANDLGVGLDPGTTYGGPVLPAADSPLDGPADDFGLSGTGLGAPDLSAAPDLPASALDDSGAMSFDTGLMAGQAAAAPDHSTADLAELIDDDEAGGEELTTVHILEEAVAAPASLSAIDGPEVVLEAQEGDVLDLDAAVDGLVEEEPAGLSLGELEVEAESLPMFEAQNSEDPADAGATRIAFADEQPAAAEREDELDDLFVELIED
ncbi:MAG: AAA family ATPase [Deltaproteobacteria bacterium]|nr:AAA family ATPase [Deltaproteobacteria bacterium]